MSKDRRDPYKFDKHKYWERRKKGLHGTKYPENSREDKYDKRILYKRKLKILQGEKDED